MYENIGLVTRIVSGNAFTIVWSISNSTLHTYEFIREVGVGDFINLSTREKISSHIDITTKVVDGLVQLPNLPVRFRNYENRIVGYSSVLGEIMLVDKAYISCVDTINSVTVVWSKQDKWSIPVFNPQVARLTPDQYEAFRNAEPCRGVAFRKENGSLVVWSEVHGIVELHPFSSRNIGNSDPGVGSFLIIRVIKNSDRQYPLISNYKVIEPFFVYNTNDESSELSIVDKVVYEGFTEIINNKPVQYAISQFFGRIYDNYDSTRRLLSSNYYGTIEITFHGINFCGSPLMFQVLSVRDFLNNLHPSNSPISHEKQSKLSYIFTGFGITISPLPSVYCVELKLDVLLPRSMRKQRTPHYWLGKWFQFSVVMDRKDHVMVNPVEIEPAWPTRIVNGFVEVQVNLMTPTMIKCSELFAPDLACEIDGVDGASGIRTFKFWVIRKSQNIWSISPSELRSLDLGCPLRIEDAEIYLPESLPRPWKNRKSSKNCPNSHYLIPGTFETRLLRLSVPPGYAIGFINSRNPMFVYCPQKTKDYVVDETKLGASKYKWLGVWVYIRLAVLPNGKEEIIDIKRLPQALFPTRVIGEIVEVQMECFWDGNRDSFHRPILYCPDLKAPINDMLEVIRIQGVYRLWIARNKCRDVWFHIAQDEHNVMPLRKFLATSSS